MKFARKSDAKCSINFYTPPKGHLFLRMNYYVPLIGEKSTPTIINLKHLDWKGGLLIRSTNWLGDAIIGLPALYKLKKLLPEGIPMAVVCPLKLKNLWQNISWIDGVYFLLRKAV